LSTIAIGMLNRSRRFITRSEVERDYIELNVSRADSGSRDVVRVDDAVGQFFFLYRAQAQHLDSTFYEGYEFIHSTFGEFLAARIIAHQLRRAADVLANCPTWDRTEAERHARSLLIPYLAQRPLVREEQAMAFLEDIVGTLVKDRLSTAHAV